ncbi:MAG: methyltransferase domain-containing protein [Acidobacteriota bacterium]
MSTDQWDPAQYNKFRSERMQPFFDLLQLVKPVVKMRVIDLGCGTGELTAMLVEQLPDAQVEGIDSSPAMLAQAGSRASPQLSFRLQNVLEVADYSDYNLVFSHAALQWVANHEELMAKILSQLKLGAQVAIQMPKNERHPSHRVASELAQESPFRELLNGYVARSNALEIERYAELLYQYGFQEQVCLEKIYGHTLSHTTEVIEWVKGTLLSSYLVRLRPADQTIFLAVYRSRLLAVLGEQSPYFYPYRRQLIWARKIT